MYETTVRPFDLVTISLSFSVSFFFFWQCHLILAHFFSNQSNNLSEKDIKLSWLKNGLFEDYKLESVRV